MSQPNTALPKHTLSEKALKLALLSIFFFGITAPFALVMGLKAMRQRKQSAVAYQNPRYPALAVLLSGIGIPFWATIIVGSEAQRSELERAKASIAEASRSEAGAALGRVDDRVKPASPDEHQYTCLFTGATVTQSCYLYEGAADTCTPTSANVHCRDGLSLLDSSLRINNWRKSGAWNKLANSIWLLHIEASEPDTASERICYQSHLQGSDVHICAQHGGLLSNTGRLDFRGYVKFIDYHEGVISDDLWVEPLESFTSERFEAETELLRFAQLLKASEIPEEMMQSVAQPQHRGLIVVGIPEATKAPEARLALLWQQAQQVIARVGSKHVEAELRSVNLSLDKLSAGSKDFLEMREQAVGQMSKLQLAFWRAATPEQLDASEHGVEWAVSPTGATGCDGKRIDVPDRGNEFESRRELARRAEIVATVKGRQIAIRGAGDAKAGFDFGPYSLATSSYDFNRKKYTITISSDGGTWPIGAERPVVKSRRIHSFDERKIGSIGGKDLRLTTAHTDTDYEPYSALKIDLGMSESEAEHYQKNMPIEVFVVLENTGYFQHKICRRSCDIILGTEVCDTSDTGLGLVRTAKTVGYEIYLNGVLVSAKQPS